MIVSASRAVLLCAAMCLLLPSMSGVSADPAISEQAWERSIDDPFSADAMGLLQHITPSTTAQQQPAAVTTLLPSSPTPTASPSRFSPSSLRRSLTVAPAGRRSSAVTPTSHQRASIYEEEEEGRQSQEDNNSSAAQPRPAPAPARVRRAVLGASPHFVRVKVARAENWLRQDWEDDQERQEVDADAAPPAAAPLDDLLGGFTTGSSKPVSVSAASMERARQLMAEADEEFSKQHERRSGEDGSLLRSAPRNRQQSPQPDPYPQPQPSRRPLASPTAVSARPSSLLSARKTAAFAPPASFQTPARLSLPALSPAGSTSLSSPPWPVRQQLPSPPLYERLSADGGLAGESDLMAGFATGSGRRVTVSESSLKRAHQLMREAEEEEADRRQRTTSDVGPSTELLHFKSIRSHQQTKQQPHLVTSSIPLPTPSISSYQTRPPQSTFRAPTRLSPRHPQPPPPPAHSSAATVPESIHTFPQAATVDEQQLQRQAAQSTSARKLSKSDEFDLWLKEQGMQVDEADTDAMMLLPPQMSDTDNSTAMAPNGAAAATLLTFDEEPDSAVLSSLPSTESSAFTSSPASVTTTSSHLSPRPLSDSLHAASCDGFGGLVTGADASVSGKKPATIRPETAWRAQKLMAETGQQVEAEYEESDVPMMTGFVTGGGRKAAALRPESLMRAQQLLADVDEAEQQQTENEAGKENDTHMAAQRSAPSHHKGRPPLAALPVNALPPHARDALNSSRVSVSHAGEQRLVASRAAQPEDKPLLARRQVGKRLNEKSAVELHHSPLADSPLPSPATVLLHVKAERAAAAINRSAMATSKKRKLTFNTPRTIAPGMRHKGKRSDCEKAQQPNLLSTRGEHKSSTAQPASSTPAKGTSASLPTPPFSMPPAPLPVRSADVLQFSLGAHSKERWSRDELLAMGVSSAIVDMTSYDALTYTFPYSADSIDSSSSSSCYSATTAYFHLLEAGCDRSLLSPLWVRNHYRWIVWKLACIERSYPTSLKGRCCTYYQVMAQLRHRVHKELEVVKRPALAKLLEQDESAAKYMVLCVAALLPAAPSKAADASDHGAGERVADATTAANDVNDEYEDDPDTAILLHRKQFGVCQLELTDGWYSVAAKLDAPLLQQLHRDRIRVGDKLRVFNASLAGATDACSPLENDNVYLELHHNSTRRASHECKLGVQRTATYSVCLASVREGGGAIPCMHAAVGRVYPIMCMEVVEDGTKVHRNQRAEDARQEQWERRVEKEMEQKREEWQQKMEQSTARSHCQQPHMPTPDTQSQSSQLSHSDPTSIALSAELLELEAPEPRRLVPYLKARLYEIVPPAASVAVVEDELVKKADGTAPLPAVLTGAECTFTVWRPTEEDMHALTEGSVVTIYSAQVAGRHDGILRLSSSRSTPIITNVHVPPLTSLFRRLCTFPELHALQRSDEFDIAVCVVYEQRYSGAGSVGGEQQHTRQLYCCYDSDDLLMIDVREDDSQLHFTAGHSLVLPTTLLACNLRYTGYDRVHRVHTAQSSASAAFVTRTAVGADKHETDKGSAPRRPIMDGWRACRQWFSSDSGKAVAELHRRRAVALVDGIAVEEGQVGDAGHTALVGSQRWSDALFQAIAAAQSDAVSARSNVCN